MSNDTIASLFDAYRHFPRFSSHPSLAFNPKVFKAHFGQYLTDVDKIIHTDPTLGEMTVLDCALFLDQRTLVKSIIRHRYPHVSDTTLYLMTQKNEYDLSDALRYILGPDFAHLERCPERLFDFPAGSTFLHFIAQSNNLFIIKKIPSGKVNVNIQNSEGQTPLHVAIEKGHWEMVKHLIALGADMNLTDKKGVSGNVIRDLQHKIEITTNDINQRYANATATDFDNAVTAFLKAFDLSDFAPLFQIENRLFRINPMNKLLRETFWSLDATRYLHRENYTLNRTRHVNFSPKETEFYHRLGYSNAEHFIPFRADSRLDKSPNESYLSGLNKAKTKFIADEFIASCSHSESSPLYLHVHNNAKKYFKSIKAAAQCGQFCTDEYGFAYVITILWDEEHARVLLTIIDTNQKTPVGCFLINSSNSLVDFLWMYIGIREAAKSPPETLFYPLRNCSIDIQTHTLDKNCALYSFEFSAALFTLWRHSRAYFQALAKELPPAIQLSEVYTSLEPIQSEMFTLQTESMKAFSDALKAQLSSLFDSQNDLAAHSYEHLKSHFLDLRLHISCGDVYAKREKAFKQLTRLSQAFLKQPPASNLSNPFRLYLQDRTQSFVRYEQLYAPLNTPPTLLKRLSSFLNPIKQRALSHFASMTSRNIEALPSQTADSFTMGAQTAQVIEHSFDVIHDFSQMAHSRLSLSQPSACLLDDFYKHKSIFTAGFKQLRFTPFLKDPFAFHGGFAAQENGEYGLVEEVKAVPR